MIIEATPKYKDGDEIEYLVSNGRWEHGTILGLVKIEYLCGQNKTRVYYNIKGRSPHGYRSYFLESNIRIPDKTRILDYLEKVSKECNVEFYYGGYQKVPTTRANYAEKFLNEMKNQGII